MPNHLAQETSPYLLQHKDNPVDWYPWGEEALTRARDDDRPLLVSIGYSACHWCHVMERESFEDTETAAFMNEHFVCVKVDREERPDVDADLHGGVPGNDRRRRLAAERVRDPRAGAVPRRHLLPAAAPSRHAHLAAGARGGGGGLGHAPRRDPRRATRRPPRRFAARPGSPPPRSRCTRACSRRRSARSATPTTAHPGGFGGAPKFPQPRGARVPASARRARDVDRDPARDGLRRDLRPGGRRVRPLLGGRAVARSALREDALRQRAAGPRVPARVAGVRRPPPRRGLRRDARLGAARDARAGGRLLLGARRGLRGRGGPLLRLDARTSSARRSATTPSAAIAYFGVSENGNFEGRNILTRAGEPPENIGGDQATPLRGAGAAGVAEHRRQAPDRVERPHDRRAGRGGRRARGAALRGRRGRVRRVRLARAARRRRAAASDLEGRPGAAQRLPRGPRVPGRGAADASTRRPSTRAGSARRARRPTR